VAALVKWQAVSPPKSLPDRVRSWWQGRSVAAAPRCTTPSSVIKDYSCRQRMWVPHQRIWVCTRTMMKYSVTRVEDRYPATTEHNMLQMAVHCRHPNVMTIDHAAGWPRPKPQCKVLSGNTSRVTWWICNATPSMLIIWAAAHQVGAKVRRDIAGRERCESVEVRRYNDKSTLTVCCRHRTLRVVSWCPAFCRMRETPWPIQ
jgi:hypothetical protein